MEDTKAQDLDGLFPNQVRSDQGSPLGNRSLQLFGKARSNNGDFPGSRDLDPCLGQNLFGWSA